MFPLTTSLLPGAQKKEPAKPGKPADTPVEQLSGKKLENYLKKQAAKAQREDKAEKKKAEAARAKEAKATSKRVVQTATKIIGPLSNAVGPAANVLKKAEEAGLEGFEVVKELAAYVKTLGEWSNACTKAMSYFAKNNGCELADLDFGKDEGLQACKECNACVKEVRKLMADTKKAQAKAKAAGGA